MVVQIVSVVAVILDHRWKEWPVYRHYFFPIHWIAQVAIWFMVCVSLVSAVDYFVAFWSKIDQRGVKRRRRAFILSRRRNPCRRLKPTAMSLPRPSSAAVESGEFSQGEFSKDERSLLLRLAHDSILSALERHEIPAEPADASSLRASRRIHYTVSARRTTRVRGLRTARKSGVPRRRRHRARRRLRGHALSSCDAAGSARAGNRTEHSVAAAAHLRRSHRNRPPRPADHHGRTSRPAPARKCPRNTTGTAPRSSNRPAAKPACLWMPGKTARPSRPSPRKFSEISTYPTEDWRMNGTAERRRIEQTAHLRFLRRSAL